MCRGSHAPATAVGCLVPHALTPRVGPFPRINNQADTIIQLNPLPLYCIDRFGDVAIAADYIAKHTRIFGSIDLIKNFDMHFGVGQAVTMPSRTGCWLLRSAGLATESLEFIRTVGLTFHEAEVGVVVFPAAFGLEIPPWCVGARCTALWYCPSA